MVSLISKMASRIFDSASENREVWASLTCAWLVLWAAGVYGAQYLMPQVQRNTDNIAEVGERVGQLDEKVTEVKEDVSDVKVTLLVAQIIDAKRVQCAADTDESRRYFTERLADLMRLYERTTGRYFRLPGCEELRVERE